MPKQKALLKHKPNYWALGLILLGACIYIILHFHLSSLTTLPVFADEAIYIRWAQLIIDDWQRYLFFPMNDGKTPLFIWLLVPFQFVFRDQLFAARFLSVLVGLAQAWIMALIIKEFGLPRKHQLIAVLFSLLLPYWYFHHHLALMDGLMTLFISLTILFVFKLKNNFLQEGKLKKNAWYSTLVGVCLGLAIWTKIPALLLIPSLYILLLIGQESLSSKAKQASWLSLSVLLGLGIFLSLKLHPAFSQLFSRGNDFLFPWQEVILQGKWRETLPSWPNYLSYFVKYLTWPIMLLSVIGLFFKKNRTFVLLHLAWLSYALPIFLLGRVVYPRYLFSVSIFFTLLAVLVMFRLEQIKSWFRYILTILFVFTAINSLSLIYTLAGRFESGALVPIDRVQYLTEWSAGFGVKETVELVQELAQEQRVLVLSEGYFGTLPDGLLMYLHRQPVDNLFIQPIGWPINAFKPEVAKQAKNYNQVLLVANSHRIQLDLADSLLIADYCRPFSAPCHQVWDVTHLVTGAN